MRNGFLPISLWRSDYKALDHPQAHILGKGGKIFIALYKRVYALIKMDDPVYNFELAKMAVSPKSQVKSIGKRLGETLINAARELGASRNYLESYLAYPSDQPLP